MRYQHLLCAIALFTGSVPAIAVALPTVPHVQVSGHAELKVVPDMLTIAFTITHTDPKLALARADVEQRSSAVIALAKRLDIAARDIEAQAIRIAPEYVWQNNKREYRGQRVTRTFGLTVHKLDRYPALLDGLVKAGVSSVDSVTPARSDLPALRRQALAAAMQDAHARAQTLANSADVTLGAVFSISENAGYSAPPGPRPLMMSAARTETPASADYEPGVIGISEDVSVVYLLEATH
ncbi:MAG TPA: SIMPL domain-containing protein [Gammaproteobacteria bacterium]|nr:SIMPL domain-containing protein [Gammaproteobacteria bacterium]